ncbi:MULTISPECIES: hypothetical protein [unclassified Saccharopolyspora]|uniref:hypothetical protein n=1 Tax=Saccharopolyspora TaxID=1835 RepID=UPI00190937F3|nr:hypothetical protein [Saccharopolyspora sp. HNM0986]MBK0870723.1 hypothetical protein [Saccharopolyspora sp. HNM0986]
MDSTPIYTELQEQLIDPEENNWSLSAPPEFAAALAENAEPAATEAEPAKHHNSKGRGKKRRHRADD